MSKYLLRKSEDILKKDKFGINLDLYPNIGDSGVVIINTESGHNQEFYNKKSSFNYIVLEGGGSFFLDDEEVKVGTGDFLQILPGARIYYKGKMKLLLITNPAWKEEDEIETRASVW